MKGRGVGDAVSVSYFSSMEGGGLSSVGARKEHGGTSNLRHRIGSMLRSSSLGSACSMTTRNVSDAVQEPVFVSSRRLTSGDFRRLERLPSLPSSTASTAISSTAVAEPRRGLLMPRHRRSQSSGEVFGGGAAVDLGVCGPVRKDRRPASGGRVPPPCRPAMLMMPPVGRSVKQAGRFGLNGKQPSPAPTEASSNGSHGNDSTKKLGPQTPWAASAASVKKKKKGKAKAAPGGLRLISNPYGFTSSSSGESDPGMDVVFSTDEEEDDDHDADGTMPRRRREDETETLFSSSRSFSSDSTAGMESHYYRSSRRRRKAQPRQQVTGGVGKYATARAGGSGGIGIGGREGSSRLELDDGFRPLVSLSSSTGNGATTRVTAVACSSTTSTRHGSGDTSSPCSLSESKEGEEELLEDADTPAQKQQAGEQKQGMSRREPATTIAVGNREEDDGYAVVKESSDPYSDFRSSALEMIMERQLFGAGELERLLGAFLSLNDPSHHPVILHVFSEICEALFDNS